MYLRQARNLNVLFISTSIAPLGSGGGGGVELSLLNLSRHLRRQGYSLDVLAPYGSALDGANLIQFHGNLQPKTQLLARNETPASPDDAVLTRMCEYAREHQHRYDLIVNFSYDWLPLYLTPSFDVPLAHFISMSSLNDAVDYEISRVAGHFKHRLACYSRAQAETFPVPETFNVLGSGIELERYSWCGRPETYLAWTGRISREKALEDAVAAAERTGKTLKVMGTMEDPAYWDEVTGAHPGAPVEYAGFLPTGQMQHLLGRAQALVMTPRWVEAFGIVAIEALACGVPVVVYERGGPSEIIEDGKTGFLTRPDSVSGLVEALARVGEIDRKACRRAAENRYSLNTWGERFERWLHQVHNASTGIL